MGWSGQCGADAVPPLPSLLAASQCYTSGALPPFGASGPAFDAFWTALNEHWRASPPAEYGTRRWGVPTVCGRRLNLASLYREVCLRGGHEAVGAAKWWKRVGAGLVGVAAAQRATALGTVLKAAYQKYLLTFESACFDPGQHVALIEATRAATAAAGALGRANPGRARARDASAEEGGAPAQRPRPVPAASGRVESLALPPAPGAAGAGAGVLPAAAPAAAEMLASLAPLPGPCLVLDATFEYDCLKRAGLALLGGGASARSWALNAVGLAAAAARPPLDLSAAPPELTAGLLHVLQAGLAAAPCAAPSSSPWWLDAALAPPTAADAAATAACAAANALRNAALTRDASAARLARGDAVAAFAAVLAAAVATRASAAQEAASCLLDVLVAAAGRVDLSGGGGVGEASSDLVPTLLALATPPTVFRLRIQAVRALGYLVASPEAGTAAAVRSRARLAAPLAAALLAAPPAEARLGVKAEADGELGPAEVGAGDAAGPALRAAAAALAAEAAAAAATALASLARLEPDAIVACPSTVRTLVAAACGRLPERGGAGAALGGDLLAFALRAATTAHDSAAGALVGLTGDRGGRDALRPHAGALAARLAALPPGRAKAAAALAAALVAVERTE